MPARAPRRPAAPATYGLLIHGMTISGLAGASAQRHEVRHAVVVPRILLASWSGNTPPGHGCVPPNATVSGPPDSIRVRPRQRRSRLLAWSGRGRRARGNPCSRSPSLLPAAGLAEAFARNARTGSASAVADRTRMLPARTSVRQAPAGRTNSRRNGLPSAPIQADRSDCFGRVFPNDCRQPRRALRGSVTVPSFVRSPLRPVFFSSLPSLAVWPADRGRLRGGRLHSRMRGRGGLPVSASKR